MYSALSQENSCFSYLYRNKYESSGIRVLDIGLLFRARRLSGKVKIKEKSRLT